MDTILTVVTAGLIPVLTCSGGYGTVHLSELGLYEWGVKRPQDTSRSKWLPGPGSLLSSKR